jgi:hypothetical protein
MPDVRADRSLESALAERARLTERYERAMGTGMEHAAYMRLRAASARVAMHGRLSAEDRRRPEPRGRVLT